MSLLTLYRLGFYKLRKAKKSVHRLECLVLVAWPAKALLAPAWGTVKGKVTSVTRKLQVAVAAWSLRRRAGRIEFAPDGGM